MDILLFGPSSSPAENNLSRPWWYEQQIFILTHHFHALVLSQRKVNILYKKGYKVALKLWNYLIFIKKINISNWFWQFLISSIPIFFCWFLKIWTHSSSFEYWNNLIERTRLQKNSEIIALEFHAVMKICIRAIHVNIFFRFTTLQIKVGEKKGEEILMTLPQLIWWLKSLKSCFFIIRSSKRLMNSVKICFSLSRFSVFYLYFEFSWFSNERKNWKVENF